MTASPAAAPLPTKARGFRRAMTSPTPATMTLTQYVDALAAAVTAAGERARSWHGAKEHRIYRGEDWVEVYECEDGTGGTGQINGRDRRFSSALASAERSLGTVTITAAPAAAIATPTVVSSQHGRCAECDGPTRNGPHVLCLDASGLRGWCCSRCAPLSAAARSFA